MKKVFSILLATMLMVSIFSVGVSAHGHGRRSTGTAAASSARYAVCAVEDCEITGVHQHNGTNYCGHYYGDGHDYHEACTTVDGCLRTGEHSHAAGGCGGGFYRSR